MKAEELFEGAQLKSYESLVKIMEENKDSFKGINFIYSDMLDNLMVYTAQEMDGILLLLDSKKVQFDTGTINIKLENDTNIVVTNDFIYEKKLLSKRKELAVIGTGVQLHLPNSVASGYFNYFSTVYLMNLMYFTDSDFKKEVSEVQIGVPFVEVLKEAGYEDGWITWLREQKGIPIHLAMMYLNALWNDKRIESGKMKEMEYLNHKFIEDLEGLDELEEDDTILTIGNVSKVGCFDNGENNSIIGVQLYTRIYANGRLDTHIDVRNYESLEDVEKLNEKTMVNGDLKIRQNIFRVVLTDLNEVVEKVNTMEEPNLDFIGEQIVIEAKEVMEQLEDITEEEKRLIGSYIIEGARDLIDETLVLLEGD